MSKTYIICLRSQDQRLMCAGAVTATTPAEALDEYLSTLPKPFNQYELGKTSTTHDEDNAVVTLFFGPFTCTAVVELPTAQQGPL